MLRLAVPLILLLLLLFAGAAWLLDLTPTPQAPQQKEAATQPESTPGTAADEARELQDALNPPASAPTDAPSFDIARIDPNGTSVFAGRAEPGSAVAITADGKEIGVVQADENGEWTFTTDTKIPNPDAKLALFKAPPGTVPRIAEAAPPAARSAPQAGAPKPKSADAVTSNMLKNLEGMVAAARKEDSQKVPEAKNDGEQVATTAPPPAVREPPLPSAPTAVSPAAPTSTPQTPKAAALPSPIESTTVPVPVTFIFNEATLTSEGQKAAALLLEYLQLKRFSGIKLTGHADERGTDALNLALSAQRLQTVARYLRDGGYEGKLELVPMGKTEPYKGVVRGDFSQEDLWQLDRRVELMVSR